MDKISKGKVQELYQTSDDDSGIPRQARLDSNSQTTKPNSRKWNEWRELLRYPLQADVHLYL
jgi:hypothetical protein